MTFQTFRRRPKPLLDVLIDIVAVAFVLGLAARIAWAFHAGDFSNLGPLH